MIFILLFLLSLLKLQSKDDQKLKDILDEFRKLRIEVEELRNIIGENSIPDNSQTGCLPDKHRPVGDTCM